ncbi:MAG: HEAT repeat domain-containing protein [Pleurocapsa minor GSE-CHR-MK-17-07R]|jgi:HEAT repeat protein|nr:HEAT repeat domain-containing protein [Pleurocapsa minor GSE-CHR-MK 17-07R]
MNTQFYLEQLTHTDQRRRAEAARWLGNTADAAVIPALISAVHDHDGKVQYAAFSALLKLGMQEAASGMFNALLTMKTTNLWNLMKLNIGMRLRAGLLEMVQRGDTELSARLFAAVQDAEFDELQRAYFVAALGRTGDAQHVDWLLATLTDGPDAVRAAAAEALGHMGDARAVGPLLDALRHPDAHNAIREVAAEALGRIGDKSAAEPLMTALMDPNEWVRRAAAVSLGDLGDASAVESLSQAIYDESTMVQDAAFDALKKLSYTSYTAVVRNTVSKN